MIRAAQRWASGNALFICRKRIFRTHGKRFGYRNHPCANEFAVGDADILLGEIGDVPFYMSRAQFAYWEHTQLIIDAVPGNGGMFSLERPAGLRFITCSRLYSEEEWTALKAREEASA